MKCNRCFPDWISLPTTRLLNCVLSIFRYSWSPIYYSLTSKGSSCWNMVSVNLSKEKTSSWFWTERWKFQSSAVGSSWTRVHCAEYPRRISPSCSFMYRDRSYLEPGLCAITFGGLFEKKNLHAQIDLVFQKFCFILICNAYLPFGSSYTCRWYCEACPCASFHGYLSFVRLLFHYCS